MPKEEKKNMFNSIQEKNLYLLQWNISAVGNSLSSRLSAVNECQDQ